MYDFWSSSPCMEQLFLDLLLNSPNFSFSNAVLDRGIYSPISDVLLVLLTVSYGCFVSKAVIVTMVCLIYTLWLLEKCSKAFLAMTVSSDVMPVIRCTYHSPALYLFFVSIPFSWAMNPICVLIIWSINTHSSSFVALKIGLPSLQDSFVLHGFFIMAPKKHMLVAWPWRYTSEFYLTLLTTAACQMKDV